MKNIVGFKQFKTTCSDCYCIFTYEPSDVESDKVNSYVTCPHCGRHVPHVATPVTPKKENKGISSLPKPEVRASINGKPVKTMEDLEKAIGSAMESEKFKDILNEWKSIWD